MCYYGVLDKALWCDQTNKSKTSASFIKSVKSLIYCDSLVWFILHWGPREGSSWRQNTWTIKPGLTEVTPLLRLSVAPVWCLCGSAPKLSSRSPSTSDLHFSGSWTPQADPGLELSEYHQHQRKITTIVAFLFSFNPCFVSLGGTDGVWWFYVTCVCFTDELNDVINICLNELSSTLF